MEHDQQQPMRRRKARGGGGGSVAAKKSKPPRRGMGVAKLERLREQGETDRPGLPLPPPVYYGQIGPTWNPVGFPGFYGLVGSDRRFGITDSDFGVKSSDENVFKCYSLHCNACNKKKRINGDQNVTHNNKVEVVAVHRKGAASDWEGGSNQRVVMEYDFFPAAAETGGEDGGCGGLGESAVGGFEGSNCVDLSLKLSY